MRVAVVVKNLTMGGMQRASVNLSEMFANEGHEAHLIYLKPKRAELKPSEKVKLHLFDLEKALKLTVIGLLLNIFAKILNGIFRFSFFFWQGYLLTPIFKYKLKKLEKSHGEFDLIIIRGQGSFEMIWRYNNKKLVLQQVNTIRKLNTPFFSFFLQKLFNNKNVMCNAQSIYTELVHDFEKNNVRINSLNVIPSPIIQEKILTKSMEFNPEFKNKYLINVGRFSYAKNISFLLKSYSYAKKHLGLKHSLVLVGDGELKEEYLKIISELDIEKDVHFTGLLQNPYPWIRCADLFTFSSLNEGLPNVLLESLSCKTNIVSTKGKGGTLDIMSGDLANNLTEFNEEEFAKKIIEVLNSEQKIDYEKHLEIYKPSSVAQMYEELYTK